MRLQIELKAQLAHSQYQDIALLMGYRTSLAKAAQRIRRVVEGAELGLGDQVIFDFKFSAEDFLRELCWVVGIDESAAAAEIARIKDVSASRKNLFHRFIFVDTDFKRENEGIISLAALDALRFI